VQVLIPWRARLRTPSLARATSPTPPRTDLLSSAAHELRTPLTTLLAQAQAIERRLLKDPDIRPDVAAVHRIAQEAARLRFLIQELLDASRIEHGELVGEREAVDLVELARAACAARAPGSCVVEAAAPVVGIYDRQRMRLVLEALIDNAVKYSPVGGPARVLVWERDGCAYVAVQDHGVGIAEEDQPRVFDRFFRGGNAADHAVPGLGLGLYLARAIVRAHHGAIALRSTPLGGTAVTVVLPIQDPSIAGVADAGG
jgi:signal transduction histidine kinase